MASEKIIEPNFEGEEMTLPEGSPPIEMGARVTRSSVISGPIVVLLGVILLAILGGLYYWYYTVMSIEIIEPTVLSRPTVEENNEPESTTAEARTSTMNIVSTSDEIDAIEADIQSTNLNDLDSELNAIDAELEAALSAE